MSLSEYPKNVVEQARRAMQEHPDCLPEAIEAAEDYIVDLDNYGEFVGTLITRAIKEIIYDLRSRDNVVIRKATAKPPTSKLNYLGSTLITSTYDNVYNYSIGGKRLAMIEGDELPRLEKQERDVASGHLFNATLCAQLAKKVKGSQKVQDVYSERQLYNLFKKLRQPTA